MKICQLKCVCGGGLQPQLGPLPPILDLPLASQVYMQCGLRSGTLYLKSYISYYAQGMYSDSIVFNMKLYAFWNLYRS